jgi:hypothetical protein
MNEEKNVKMRLNTSLSLQYCSILRDILKEKRLKFLTLFLNIRLERNIDRTLWLNKCATVEKYGYQ